MKSVKEMEMFLVQSVIKKYKIKTHSNEWVSLYTPISSSLFALLCVFVFHLGQLLICDMFDILNALAIYLYSLYIDLSDFPKNLSS